MSEHILPVYHKLTLFFFYDATVTSGSSAQQLQRWLVHPQHCKFYNFLIFLKKRSNLAKQQEA